MHKTQETKSEQQSANNAGSVSMYAVLDFEATCEQDKIIQPQEIIEIPVILLDAGNGKEMARFHSYVQPVHRPLLTAFCTELTGITQATVNGAQPFADVFHDLMRFFAKNRVTRNNVMFVTCGDWDLASMLPRQCALSQVACPTLFRRWINIKKEFQRHHGVKPTSLTDMVDKAGLPLYGRPHSGIDDCVNVVRVLQQMIASGYTAN